MKADKAHVKVMGRTYWNEKEERWMVGTCSGIAFTMKGTMAEVKVLADNYIHDPEQVNVHARMGIFVNGKLVTDAMIDEDEKTYQIFSSEVVQDVTISILKLSESAFGDFGISDISVVSENGIHPVPPKKHRIEFVGDSITCGYGVEDSQIDGGFKTCTENGMKSYAYKTIRALDVDYSICSASGFGIISGYTDTDEPLADQLIPPYYDKISFSRSTHPNGVNPCMIDWDFSSYQPEAVIVNLGTNDTSFVKENKDRQEEFTSKYVNFLYKIRKNNPNAKIICILGIMGNSLYPAVEEAVKRFQNQTGDNNSIALRFEDQKEEDGYCVDWHPSELTHTKAAKKLTEFVKKEMNW